MNAKGISAKKQLGNAWLSVLQSHNVDRTEILRHCEKDGTLIPYDYTLTSIEYAGASDRFSKGEQVSLLPANPEFQPVIKVTSAGIITAHSFKNQEVVQIFKKTNQEPIIPAANNESINNVVKPIKHQQTNKKTAATILQYAGMAAMLTGFIFIFTALK